MHRRTGAVQTTIIEYEFVDGDNSEKIKDKKYREGMYECVVRAVCRQEGISYKLKALPKPIVKGAVKVTKSAFEKEVEEAKEWVKEKGISDGSRPKDPVTRQEVWIMMKNLEEARRK
jgi:hypothetical protein